MSIKDLFETQKSLSSNNLNEAALDIESPEYVETVSIGRNRFEPKVEYSKLSNFVKFGSAKKYFEDAFNRITKTYPYDGSGNEKQKWHNSSSNFDNYVYETLYPKYNGYIEIGYDSVGTTTTVDSITYTSATTPNYLHFKGTMNSGSYETTGKNMQVLSTGFGGSNIFNAEEYRSSNLYFNPSYGNTVEFWYKRGPVTLSSASVLIDVWNGKDRANPDYGRFTVEMAGSPTGSSNLLLTYMSGSDGYNKTSIGVIPNSTSWNHYAISVLQADTNDLQAELFVNGELVDTLSESTTLTEVTGSLVGYIGSLAETAYVGYGGLSGSMDEFRFWKKRRTHQEIGRNWFTQVNGGSNTDDSSYVNLGVYYKFNEGITQIAKYDSVALDYSGRTTNARITNYSSGYITRNTGSAMVSASVATEERLDPTIWPSHPTLVSLKDYYISEGLNYDYYNNSSLLNSLPEWIVEEDGENGELTRLSQILGSYFDSIYLSIKELPKLGNVSYMSGSDKPYPFYENILHSKGFNVSEIFESADSLAQLYSRDEDREFKDTLSNIKNTIYSNIYNNLVEIYKTKGTENSFRNLLRCYGIDESLVRTNYYSNFEEYELNNAYTNTSANKKYINFNDVDRNESTLFMQTSSLYSSDGYIYGSGISYQEKDIPITLEADIIFPQQYSQGSILYDSSRYSQITSSLFGWATPITGSSETTWQTGSTTDVQVYAIRDKPESDSVYFMVSSSAGSFPTLTSSLFDGVYSDERWNLALRVKPKNLLPSFTSGSNGGEYDIELYGASMILDQVSREFTITGSLTNTDGKNCLCMPKRIYAGAHRQNFTGSVLSSTDIKLGSLRYWTQYLTDDVVKSHGTDIKNHGFARGGEVSYLTSGSFDYKDLAGIDMLAMNWQFDNITSSNSSGIFEIADFSSGSVSLENVPVLGPIIGKMHSGYGYGFLGESTDFVEKVFLSTGRFTTPDNLDPRTLVRIVEKDDVTYTPNIRPSKYYVTFEKSMYSSVSDEMLKWFGNIKEFNNLIGSPKNRYMFEYKELGNLREKFFNKVGNTPDLEKYFELYKWIDSSLSKMLMQLVPASAKTNDIFNVVESHAFERNKYWNKLPTTEYRYTDPENNALGIGSLSYKWSTGHAPLSGLQSDNCNWWKSRWEKKGTVSETFVLNLQNSYYKKLTTKLVKVSSEIDKLSTSKLSIPQGFKNNSFTIDLSSITNVVDCDD